jgi:hypothetical protein
VGEENTMSLTMSRFTRTIPLSLALPVLLLTTEAKAQCHGGQQQNRSQQLAMGPQSFMQAAMQQSALQAAMQQAALQAVYQQSVLQTTLQQNAMLQALRQQPQSGLQSPAVQLRATPTAGSGDAIPKPDNPEEVAARQLKIAQDLVADAETTQQQGDRARARRMHERAAERLQKIVETFAGTKAAAEAQEMLSKTIRMAKSNAENTSS